MNTSFRSSLYRILEAAKKRRKMDVSATFMTVISGINVEWGMSNGEYSWGYSILCSNYILYIYFIYFVCNST